MDEIFIFLWASCICVWYIWNTVWYVLLRIHRINFFHVAFCWYFVSRSRWLFPFLFSSVASTCFYFIISGFKQKNYNENIRQSLSGIQRAFKSTIIHVNNNHNLWWNLHTSRAVSLLSSTKRHAHQDVAVELYSFKPWASQQISHYWDLSRLVATHFPSEETVITRCE